MNFKKLIIVLAITTVLFSGCRAAPSAPPTPTSSWDENLNATARAVVAATFFAPSQTPTPTSTATVTLTPSPTQVTPAFTPTLTRADCIPAGSQAQTGQVIQVIDGETILVDIGGQQVKVRYIGINAPEDSKSQQSFGQKATTVNHDLVAGRTIELFKDTSETDRNGRLLRYVYVGNIFVNYEMVRLGLATALSNPPDTACFDAIHEAEHEASVKLAGLWSRVAPTKTPLGYGLEKVVEVPCNCSGPDLNCKDFRIQIEAQSCYNYCNSLGMGDIFQLAVGTNGKACTGLPK